MDNLAYVNSRPPRCLAPFKIAPVEMPDAEWDGHGEELNPVFQVSCTCGSRAHSISGFSWRPSEEAAERVFLSPIGLTCTSCSKQSVLIDTDAHGYDAELGHGSTTVRGEGDPMKFRCEKCSNESMEVLVRFEYPADVFGDDFEDFKGGRADLFTWVSVVGRCQGCKGLWAVADYECA